ncbi:MAG: preprotein translocase subunit YajC [Verrucomicrobiia bacterium]|jgi:preprotein translocase subunit YajC
MFFGNFYVLLALSGPAKEGADQPPFWVSMVPLLVMIFVFWFILLRPQMKQEKQREKMRKTLQKGDEIYTNGGIVGTVITVRDNTVMIRSDETKLEVLKTSVTQKAKP